MTTAGVLLAAGGGSRFEATDHKLRSDLAGHPLLMWAIDAMRDAGLDDLVVVVGADPFADLLDPDVTIVESPRWADGQAHSLQAAVQYARHAGHDAIVVGLADQPLVGAAAWRAVAATTAAPVAVCDFGGERRPPVRLASDVWDRLPTAGDEGARVLMRAASADVTVVPCPGDPIDVDTVEALDAVRRRAEDRRAVVELLGREPQGRFEVVVRDDDGEPVVLKNHPVLDDGRPMPTLYWLCGRREQVLVGRLESLKGVARAEAEVGLEAIAEAHSRYAAERESLLGDAAVAHRPTGGVGGTRVGVKCLHAHYAWWLAGGDDPVGEWVDRHLAEVDREDWPAIAGGVDG